MRDRQVESRQAGKIRTGGSIVQVSGKASGQVSLILLVVDSIGGRVKAAPNLSLSVWLACVRGCVFVCVRACVFVCVCARARARAWKIRHSTLSVHLKFLKVRKCNFSIHCRTENPNTRCPL